MIYNKIASKASFLLAQIYFFNKKYCNQPIGKLGEIGTNMETWLWHNNTSWLLFGVNIT